MEKKNNIPDWIRSYPVRCKRTTHHSCLSGIQRHIIYEDASGQIRIGCPFKRHLYLLAAIVANNRGEVKGILRPSSSVGITASLHDLDRGTITRKDTSREIVVAGITGLLRANVQPVAQHGLTGFRR